MADVLLIEVGTLVNPYAPQAPSTSRQRKTAPLFVTSAIVASVAFISFGPGIVYVTSGLSSRMAAGRRYATYDAELYLLGIPITPTTAQVLAFGVAPLMIALSMYLVFRGVRKRGSAPRTPAGD